MNEEMTLAELLEGIDPGLWTAFAENNYIRSSKKLDGILICDVVYDSRRVDEGSLFVAIKGYETDGHKYVGQAIESGASAIIMDYLVYNESVELKNLYQQKKEDIVILLCANTRKALAQVSARFFSSPWRDVNLVGITGTNGKTSITYILDAIWKEYGLSSALIGTIEYKWPGKAHASHNTTPESRDLSELFAEIRESGAGHVAMEVSSHALFLERVSAFQFSSAIFTNLTQDHLDFHRDFEEYFLIKASLFDPSLLHGYGVINTDDEYGNKLFQIMKERGQEVFSFSFSQKYENLGRHYYAKDLKYDLHETNFTLVCPDGKEIPFSTSLKGRFNVLNASLAIIQALRDGLPEDAIQRALKREDLFVPGRFEVVRTEQEQSFITVVDYAHTPDALENVLRGGRDLKPDRIITVFGCGGDRDRGKRPKMGSIAEKLSEHVIVTSDNPRTEDPKKIIDEIEAGMTQDHETIVDRREAIFRAVNLCEPGDLLIIAGKGHEDYQILGKTKIHFDDREVAREALENRDAGTIDS